MLQWAFVRDDQPRADTCRQIALALRDEVCDLERAGIAAIQIDEPALREGLPLRKTHTINSVLRPQWQAHCKNHDRGFCSENGDFGPEWQGVSEHDMESLGDETDW